MATRAAREAEATVAAVLGGAPTLVIALDGCGAWCAPAGGSWAAAALGAGRCPGARAAPAALPLASATVPALVLSFVGSAASAGVRAALLAEARRILAPGGRVALLDHNRPRRRPAALAAVVGAPRPPGASPAARWRRLAYPTAREARETGLAIECLRLAAGERLQVVGARRV